MDDPTSSLLVAGRTYRSTGPVTVWEVDRICSSGPSRGYNRLLLPGTVFHVSAVYGDGPYDGAEIDILGETPPPIPDDEVATGDYFALARSAAHCEVIDPPPDSLPAGVYRCTTNVQVARRKFGPRPSCMYLSILPRGTLVRVGGREFAGDGESLRYRCYATDLSADPDAAPTDGDGDYIALPVLAALCEFVRPA